MGIRAKDAIYRLLDTNGDGTGTKNANGNYSSSPEEFYFKTLQDAKINRLIIFIEDTTGIQAEEYGNLASALTNGYTLVVTDENDDEVLDLCDGLKIKTNANIGRYCFDVDLKTWGSGNDMIIARWTFLKAGFPLLLNTGYRLSITFNDDLSGLIEHSFMIQGYYP